MATTIDGLNYSLPYSLPVDAEKSFPFLLIHLLIGSSTINRGSIATNQSIDYSILPPIPKIGNSKTAFKNFLKANNFDKSAEKFIRETIPENRKFYQDLLSEFSNHFTQTSKGCHTAAFVFLYRILERLSFSVPLLYCSTMRDYIGTFTDFKSLFTPDLGGELGLFKKFLKQGKFIDRIKLNITYEISFKSAQGLQLNYYNLTVKHGVQLVNLDPSNCKVEIKFCDIPELLITMRNRFFHSRTGDGKDNIQLSEIIDSDEYYECINPIFCSFLAIVTLQIIMHSYQS